MDQLNTALNANLNLFVVFSLVCLSLSLLILIGIVLSIVPQANRTLNAFEKLASTVSTELQPTLSEASRLLGGVLKLQDLAQNSVSKVTDQVSTKVEDMTGSFTRAATDAKMGTHVVGAGLFAGLRAYLQHSHDKEGHKNSDKSK